MITMETDRLVDDYLSRLEEAAAHLQWSRRAELIAEIREHIETALREEEAASEVAVRNVLERLGPPEEIVEAAEPAAAPAEPEPTGKLEIATIVALLVPFIGWVGGLVMMMLSRAWSGREKGLAFVLLLLPIVLPALVVMAESSGTEQGVPVGTQEEPPTSTSNSEVGAFVFAFLAGVPSAVYLAWRLRR
jgi:flagellar basal body-associated protein FliL